MNHLPIRVNTIRGDLPIEFDAFLMINGTFILYVRRGDPFEKTRLDRLKSKKVKQIYITVDDQPSYLKYLEGNINTAYDLKSSHSMDDRAKIIVDDQSSNAELTFENPNDEKQYMDTKEGIHRFVDFLMSSEKAIKSILRNPNKEKDIAIHGVTVAALSVALAKKLGFDNKRIYLMALGALLHDIGHQGASYAGKSVAQMTPEEKAEYDIHPQHGVNVTRTIKHFDQMVLNIIDQHEACIDGTGTPALMEHDMDPLTVVVASANAFDRMLTFDEIPVYEVQKKMMVQRIGKHPLQHIQILTEILRETYGF